MTDRDFDAIVVGAGPAGPAAAIALARAGKHKDAHIVAKFDVFDDPSHLAVQLGAHAITLRGAVEPHPGNAFAHFK